MQKQKENLSASMPKLIMAVSLIVCIGALLGAVGYFMMNKTVKKETIKTPSNTTSKELNIESLKNAEYTFGLDDEKYKLTDGSYFKRYSDSAVGMGNYIGIYEDKIVFSDFNNDGKKDAALIINNIPGNSVSYQLIVVINKNGEPIQIASEFLGEGVTINSLEIKNEKIIIDKVVQDNPYESGCCPTIRKIFEYELQDNKLIKTGVI